VKNDTGKNYTDLYGRALPEALQRKLKDPWSASAYQVPVVQYFQRQGTLPCTANSYLTKGLRQARKYNDAVYPHRAQGVRRYGQEAQHHPGPLHRVPETP